jgi:hypothetical protein
MVEFGWSIPGSGKRMRRSFRPRPVAQKHLLSLPVLDVELAQFLRTRVSRFAAIACIL